jgi:hypothetical protein
MKNTNYTLNVRTEAQRVLFADEIRWQLSDGYWACDRPTDHWKPWCDAKVAVDPTNLGRNFNAPKDNYNLTNSMLMEEVGDRMVAKVSLNRKCGKPNFSMKDLRAELKDLKAIMKLCIKAI